MLSTLNDSPKPSSNDAQELVETNETSENLTKLLTFVLEAQGNLRVVMNAEHFDDMSETETKEILANLMKTSAIRVLDQSQMYENSGGDHYKGTNINLGSLYDQVVFDCGVYLDEEKNMILNASFGQLADANLPLHKNLRELSDALTWMGHNLEHELAGDTHTDTVAQSMPATPGFSGRF